MKEQKHRDMIERHLTKTVVAQIRIAAALKVVGFKLAPSQIVGILKVGMDGKAYWAVEQRFGFPYDQIGDRDVRRLVWEALEKRDDDSTLRIVIIDQEQHLAASIRIPYTSVENEAS